MVKTPSVIEEQIFGSINDTKPMCPSHRDTHSPSCFISCPTQYPSILPIFHSLPISNHL